jgi:hypothetical protein
MMDNIIEKGRNARRHHELVSSSMNKKKFNHSKYPFDEHEKPSHSLYARNHHPITPERL